MDLKLAVTCADIGSIYHLHSSVSFLHVRECRQTSLNIRVNVLTICLNKIVLFQELGEERLIRAP